jgi:hypothetical protein
LVKAGFSKRRSRDCASEARPHPKSLAVVLFSDSLQENCFPFFTER